MQHAPQPRRHAHLVEVHLHHLQETRLLAHLGDGTGLGVVGAARLRGHVHGGGGATRAGARADGAAHCRDCHGGGVADMARIAQRCAHRGRRGRTRGKGHTSGVARESGPWHSPERPAGARSGGGGTADSGKSACGAPARPARHNGIIDERDGTHRGGSGGREGASSGRTGSGARAGSGGRKADCVHSFVAGVWLAAPTWQFASQPLLGCARASHPSPADGCGHPRPGGSICRCATLSPHVRRPRRVTACAVPRPAACARRSLAFRVSRHSPRSLSLPARTLQ